MLTNKELDIRWDFFTEAARRMAVAEARLALEDESDDDAIGIAADQIVNCFMSRYDYALNEEHKDWYKRKYDEDAPGGGGFSAE